MDPRLDGKDPEMNWPTGHDSDDERKRGGTWKTWALLTLPLLFLAVFFYLPIFNTFKFAFTNAHGQPISNKDLVGIWEPLVFTFYQAALSTILTLIIGIPAAFLFSRFIFTGKRILRTLVMVPFILPTVVVAAGFNALLGPRGWLNLALMSIFDLKTPPIDLLYSLAAILLAHVFYNTSVIIRMVGSAWSRLDIRLEQAGRVLGASAWRNFVEVTFPLLKPSILSTILVVFLFDFTSFGVILLLGGPQYATLEVDIYIQSMQLLNFPMAAILSVIQMLCTLIIIVIISRISGDTSIPLAPRLRAEGMKTATSIKEKIFVFFMAFALFLVFLTPLLALALRSITRLEFDPNLGSTVKTTLTTAYYQELFINRRGSIFFVPPIEAIRNSLVFAGMVVLISSSLGMLISAALERRSRRGKGVEILTTLPLGTSAVSLGLGLLLLFNGFNGGAALALLLVPIAHSVVAMPFFIRTVQPALESIPVTFKQSAAIMGASANRIWREITLPILWRPILAGALFAFTISLGEFGATSFLARPEFPTMPIAISRFLTVPGALNYGQAMAMSTLLMLICAACVFAIDRLE
jgi:thiamine transport system permease protein